jgi:predicted DNA-binding transcriptional regulator YafY
MAGFVDYWRDGFDWRVQEARRILSWGKDCEVVSPVKLQKKIANSLDTFQLPEIL